MWKQYLAVGSVEEGIRLLAEKGENACLVAGATDLMVELEHGMREDIGTVIDITRIPNLDYITMDENKTIHLGPLVTHNAATASKLLRARAFPLVCAAWQVGSPQIRNRATIAGNLITASPANDTITPLMALGASVTLRSIRGTRRLPLHEFYIGVRKTVMKPDEMLVEITFQALKPSQRGIFLKLGLRRTQALALVNTAIVLDLSLERVISAAITLGAVAPTIIHAFEAETFLTRKKLTKEVITHTAELAAMAACPIDDIRSSAVYRKSMTQVLVRRGLHTLYDGQEQAQVPDAPVLLSSNNSVLHAAKVDFITPNQSIHTNINGKEYVLSSGQNKSLLRLLREDVGLTGTKEGCSEGQCGACTVILDGKAVLACLVPAPRADGSLIVTVEGLADLTPSVSPKREKGKLHPVQEAFMEAGAVQCGYCAPGFLVSAAKLLEERARPTSDEIIQAISGNLCRCTGYYRIIQAIEDASRMCSFTLDSSN